MLVELSNVTCWKSWQADLLSLFERFGVVYSMSPHQVEAHNICNYCRGASDDESELMKG